MLRKFLILFAGAVIGIYAVLPHLGRRWGEFLLYVALAGVAAAVGTYLLPRMKLQLRRGMPAALQGLAIGAATAVVLVVLDRLAFAPASAGPPIWTGLLYALYGGVTQEVVFHYGLLTLLAWVALRAMPESTAYWLAIAVSAVAMGVSDGGVLNALAGLVTGWLFWRRGLEAAMIAHGVIGFALHVWAPGVFVVA